MLSIDEIKVEVTNKEISKAKKLYLDQLMKYRNFGDKTERKIKKQFKKSTNISGLKVSFAKHKLKFSHKDNDKDVLFLSDGNLQISAEYYRKDFSLRNQSKFMLVTSKLLGDVGKETNYYRFLIGKIDSFMSEYESTLGLGAILNKQLNLERERIRQRKIKAISHLIEKGRKFNFYRDTEKNGHDAVIDFGGRDKVNGGMRYGPEDQYYINPPIRHTNHVNVTVGDLFTDKSLSFVGTIRNDDGILVNSKRIKKLKFKEYIVDHCTDEDVQREIKMCEILF